MKIDWKRFFLALLVIYAIGVIASSLMIQAGIDTPIRCIVCAVIGVVAAIVYPLPMKQDDTR